MTAELRGATEKLLKKASSPVQADIVEITTADGRHFLRKDMSRHWWIVRLLWCRVILDREARALKRLEQFDWVPRLIDHTRDAIVVEWVPGKWLPRMREEVSPSPDFFARLSAAIDAMHAAGVAHGDLRRSNILWDRVTEKFWFIDFASAQMRRPDSSWWKRFVFGFVARMDGMKAEKLRRAYLEGRSGSTQHYSWPMRLAHWLRRHTYRPIKRLLRGGEKRGRDIKDKSKT